jgi:hypothetical protein
MYINQVILVKKSRIDIAPIHKGYGIMVAEKKMKKYEK